jgi:hypothetical protein
MTFLERYLKHHYRYLAALIVLLVFVNATILATSIIMETRRSGGNLPAWYPFLWEYSSALSILFMTFFIFWYDGLFPLTWSLWRRHIWMHIAGTVIFSGGHIVLMVGLRKLVMWALGGSYVFGNIPMELLYEYRKDAWSYFTLLALFYLHRFIVSRLRGEAQMIGEGESISDRIPDRLLVKKLGKEFIIKVSDIEWLEAAGNYVNLHLDGRIYPLKTTLNNLISQLADRGFMRIHRSHGVNLDYVASIEPLESGDAIVKLKNEVCINLSRRYRDEFRKRLGV